MNPLEMLRLDLDIVHEQQLLSAAAVKRSKQLRIVGLHLDAKKEITDVSDAKRRLLKTFLISDVRNKNQWRVSWNSIKQYAKSFVGFPGIAYEKCEMGSCDLDHTQGATYEGSLENQKEYIVSNIIDVVFDEVNHTAWAIHEVLDDEFWEEIRAGRIKYVSPAIWPSKEHVVVIEPGEDGIPLVDCTKWQPLHLAFVHEPAYGITAEVRAHCTGGAECYSEVLQASSKDPFAPDSLSMMMVRHGSIEFVTASSCVQKKIQQKVDSGIKIDDQALAIAYSECNGSKGGSLNAKCTPCSVTAKAKKLEEKLAKITI